MKSLTWITITSVATLVLLGAMLPLAAQSPKAKSKNTKPAGANPAAAEAQRGDWSRWRGPNLDGISLETGLLSEWPAEGPPLVWRVKGLGRGFSSVAIAGGKIYTLGKKNRNNLVCLKTLDGSIEWTTPIGGGGDPNSTPTIDGEMVYGVSLGGDLACCKTDGTLVWAKNYEKDLGGKMMSSWGFSESVLVDGDKVICTPGGDQALLAALDKKSGEVVWQTAASQGSLGRKGGNGAGYASVVISNA